MGEDRLPGLPVVVRALYAPDSRVTSGSVIGRADREVGEQELLSQRLAEVSSDNLGENSPTAPLVVSRPEDVVEDIERELAAPESRLIAGEENRVKAAEVIGDFHIHIQRKCCRGADGGDLRQGKIGRKVIRPGA